jgi:hypothetical protein
MSDELPIWKHDVSTHFEHKPLNDIAGVLFAYYQEHLRRDIDDGKLQPIEYWILLRGFLSASWQTYRGVCTLLASTQRTAILAPGRSLESVDL